MKNKYQFTCYETIKHLATIEAETEDEARDKFWENIRIKNLDNDGVDEYGWKSCGIEDVKLENTIDGEDEDEEETDEIRTEALKAEELYNENLHDEVKEFEIENGLQEKE